MLPGVIVRSHHNEQEISFFISNQNDAVQRSHYAGKFYEIEELRIISNWFGVGDILLDIGANIGNHTIFACKILRAKQSIVIEPNPPAIDMLRVNIDLNGLRGLVDMSLLGIGVSDADTKATATFPVNNLGAARLSVDDSNGTLRLVPGDSIVRGRKIDSSRWTSKVMS
jgi:FkbM family methyltransferase